VTADSRIVGIVGAGVTGGYVATRLVEREVRVAVFDEDPALAEQLARRVDGAVLTRPDELEVTDAVALCHGGPHHPFAAELARAGVPTVSLSDGVDDLRAMLDLDVVAAQAGSTLVVGAGMAPGLSGLLAGHCARQVHSLEEIHVAIHGTAGPACARAHHRALASTALAWMDGQWVERPGGSGRELCWFPEPIGARDCYRAGLGDPLLLQRIFPTAGRVSARVSATRRDRLTARLPMLLPPHPAGGIGAVRAEVRGSAVDGARVTTIAGASGPVGALAGAVAAASVLRLLDDDLAVGVHQPCSSALDPPAMLRRLHDLGLVLQEFTGVPRATG
jgi:hypothetical protein